MRKLLFRLLIGLVFGSVLASSSWAVMNKVSLQMGTGPLTYGYCEGTQALNDGWFALTGFSNRLIYQGYTCAVSSASGGAVGGGTIYISRVATGLPGCPPDKIFDVALGCRTPPPPTCTSPQYLDTATQSCVSPPTCASGQHVDSTSHLCVADVPEPELGSGRDVSVVVCEPPTDCSSQGNWTPWSDTVNDNGWVSSISSPSTCTEAAGIVSCNSNTVYQGAGAAPTSLAVASSPVSGGTNAVQNTCTTGYTYDAAVDRCTLSSGGTASTPTTPGSEPVVSNTCPVGYSIQADGRCVSATPTAYTCPEGYTKGQDGKCSSVAGTVPPLYGAGAGSGANAVSSCGGPGQPACNVNTGIELGQVPAAESLLTAQSPVSSIVPVDLGGPAAVCPAPVQLPHGLSWRWDTVCSFASFLRPLVLALAWLSAGMMVLGAGKADV